MDTNVMNKIFGVHHYALGLNLDGLTDEESRTSPAPGGNCVNWVLGHIIASRADIMKLLGAESTFAAEHVARYARGSAGDAAAGNYLPLDALQQELNRSQEALSAALAAATPERLAAPIRDDTVYGTLAFLQFHEGYHVGQIGVLRRVLGHKGQIA
ncbi:MAG: DinB family protein [Candidatus Eisenbacteria bacterium]